MLPDTLHLYSQTIEAPKVIMPKYSCFQMRERSIFQGILIISQAFQSSPLLCPWPGSESRGIQDSR